MSSKSKTIIEERHSPEDEGLLGSRITSATPDGSIIKEIKVPFCDCCGEALKDEKIAICPCKRKICQTCSVTHEGKTYCKDCVKQITGVTKEDFFILFGLSKEAKLKDIQKASLASEECIETAIESLIERDLVKKKGLLFFTVYRITNSGLSLLATSEQVYCNEGDILRFITKLEELLAERKS